MRRITFVALAVLVAGCSPNDAAVETTGSTSVLPSIDLEEFDPGALVLQVTHEGGLGNPYTVVLTLPAYSLYADGTLLVPGSLPPARSLSPILQPVDSVKLDEADVEMAAALIEAIGLPTMEREVDGSRSRVVIDAASTIATFIDASGVAHQYGVYALGYEHDTVPILEATRSFTALLSVFDDAVARSGSVESLEPLRLQFIARGPDHNERYPVTKPWPLPVDPAEFESDGSFDVPCHVLDGEEALAAVLALEDGNRTTRWDYAGTRLVINARPLVPGEPGCGSLDG